MSATKVLSYEESCNASADIYDLKVNLAEAIDSPLIAAVTGQQIQILGLMISVDTACNVTIESGSGTEEMTFVFGTTGGLFRHAGNRDIPLMVLPTGKALELTLSAVPTTGRMRILYRMR